MTTVEAATDPLIGRRRLTREQQALEELGHTKRSRGTCEMLTIVFLLTIALVPLFETVSDLWTNFAARRALAAQGVPVEKLPGRRPRSFEIFYVIPTWRQIAGAKSASELVTLIPPSWRFRVYEDALVLNSAAGKLIRPWTQWVLTGWLRIGNEKVEVGRDGWLFYGDGFQYVTGPGFLDPAQLAQRVSHGFNWPDPRPAIIQFSDELKALGVSLVVLPIPDKVMISPGSFSPRAAASPHPAQNRSWDVFARDLQQHGVHLLDIGQSMYDEEAGGHQMFLRYDSHWTPAGADVAARLLAHALEADGVRNSSPRIAYRRTGTEATRTDDLVPLLGLPASRALIVSPSEQYHVDHVVGPDGVPWQADPSSDVLIVGDSFLESYLDAQAGLGPALSYYTRSTVDVRASRFWGRYGAREALGKTLQDVRNAARGRRVIVWQFAIRSLAVNDWKPLQ
jgi:alginate O-acetyltransferase complex protein AlgJ